MPKPQLGRFNRPQSLAQLTRGRGWNSELAGFLLPFATRDFIYREYDFLNDTITADWTVSNSSGTSAADYAVTETENGTVQGDTGTTDDGAIQINFDRVIFDAARNPGMEVRSYLDAVTGFGLEMAFSDAPTTAYTKNTTAVSAAGAPTITSNGVTDICGIQMDTDFTLGTASIFSKGTTDAASGALLGTFLPTAATYFVARLQVVQNGGYAIIDDAPGQAASLILGPDTAKLMRPHVICVTRNTTAKFHDIDYIRLWAERKA